MLTEAKDVLSIFVIYAKGSHREKKGLELDIVHKGGFGPIPKVLRHFQYLLEIMTKSSSLVSESLENLGGGSIMFWTRSESKPFFFLWLPKGKG